MGMIVPMIMSAIKDNVIAVCQTPFPESDPTRVKLVKLGRFQSNPIDPEQNVHVSISGGDPDDPNYRDGIVTLETMQNIAMNVPAREFPGKQYWWRRGILDLECFFITERYDQITAMNYAYTILGRVSSAVENTIVNILVDDFGERAKKVFMHSSTFVESGGPPSSYIWRGKLFWNCLTSR